MTRLKETIPLAVLRSAVYPVTTKLSCRASVSGEACGSSMTMMSPPRPVNVPPAEVASRNPRAVSSISLSEFLYGPARVEGNADRYQGDSSTARKSLACFLARSPE
jgi:hypothetical protein